MQEDNLTTIHVDESGYTGSDLLNPDQPFFAVASTDLSRQEAEAILRIPFPAFGGEEFKATRIFKGRSYRPGILKLVEQIAVAENRFYAYIVSKRYCVLTKLVDFLIEPIFRANGYDFYADSFPPKYVNLVYASMGSENEYSSILSAYQEFAREPSREALEVVKRKFDEIHEVAGEHLRSHLKQAIIGLSRFEDFYDYASFKDSSDLHIACALACVAFWRERSQEDFVLEHDESSAFFKGEALWNLVTSANAKSGQIVGPYGRVTSFPLRVRSTAAIDSKQSPSIQLADLVAGMLTRVRRWQSQGAEGGFIEELFAAGLNTLNSTEIGPEADYPTAWPRRLNGPDAIDQFRDFTFRR